MGYVHSPTKNIQLKTFAPELSLKSLDCVLYVENLIELLYFKWELKPNLSTNGIIWNKQKHRSTQSQILTRQVDGNL